MLFFGYIYRFLFGGRSSRVRDYFEPICNNPESARSFLRMSRKYTEEEIDIMIEGMKEKFRNS